MSAMDEERADLEQNLDSFDPVERGKALRALAGEHGSSFPAPGGNFNMHCHSFFSYNALGYSPSHIAWEARKAGLYAAGLCDFDVLDGLDEFLQAGLTLGLRTAVSLETRAYLQEYADVDISSPGEPGVTYIMGAGFAHVPAAGSQGAAGLAGYRERAMERNVALVGRINARVPDIAIDYEGDVLPLTPAGAATERHIVRAYIHKARDVFEHPETDASFWSDILGKSFEEIVELLADEALLEEAVRARLVKRGGFGYEQPSPTTFPPTDEFIRWVLSCEAIPMMTWLDGTSAGEEDARALLECMAAKGAAAINIIPDRNWNITDPDTHAVKTAKLEEIVREANAMEWPVNIGTEMNKPGLPFVDDLEGEALRAHSDTFMRGARIMVGHTLLLKYAGLSYVGEKAAATLKDRTARNGFFESVGAMLPMDEARAAALEDMGEEKALAWFYDETKK